MAPIIFIVPGIYEGPDAFAPLAATLQAAGYRVHITHLISTGSRSPGNPSMHDDATFIASELSREVEAAGEDGVVAVMHSAGGFLGSMALKGLSAKARGEKGKKGGVRRIVFLTAGLGPEGFEHKPLPFMEFHDDQGYHTCADPRNSLFNDFSDSEAQEWITKMQCQPSRGWDGTVEYCGWREVPSVYVICEEDRMVPPSFQQQLSSLAGCEEIFRLKGAGHMAQLSRTSEVAEIVIEQARKLGK